MPVSLVLNDAERARVVADGYLTVAEAARISSFSESFIRKQVRLRAFYAEIHRSPGSTRNAVRIPRIAFDEWRRGAVQPLQNQIVGGHGRQRVNRAS